MHREPFTKFHHFLYLLCFPFHLPVSLTLAAKHPCSATATPVTTAMKLALVATLASTIATGANGKPRPCLLLDLFH